jgi:Na+-translocating ferredoxin:NAD+ oxidoreductase RnfC subunit
MFQSPRRPAASLCFPPRTSLIQRHTAKWPQIARVGRSACDQCRFCTEFCPRYLLGHPIQPHRAMQSLGFSPSPAEIIAGTLYCCECNLCSLYACPEDLDPKNVCVSPSLRRAPTGSSSPGRRSR